MARDVWYFVHAVGWAAFPPAYAVQREARYDYQLTWVKRGKGWIVQAGRIYHAVEGELIYLDLSIPYQYRADADDPWEIYWVHFGGKPVPNLFHTLRSDSPVTRLSAHLVDSFAQLYELAQRRLPGFEPRASAIIGHVLGELIARELETGRLQSPGSAGRYPEAVQKSLAYIENNYRRQVRLEEVAQQASLSPYHFSRVFKRTTGLSVMEYLLRYRIMQAKHLLSQSALQVREIAERVGFSDAGYFSKMFRQTEGLTPKEYRIQATVTSPDETD